MPDLDGLGVLRALPRAGAPRVVVVSISDADSELGRRGARRRAPSTLVHKPTALATDRLYELGDELVEKVARPRRARAAPRHRSRPAAAAARARALAAGAAAAGGDRHLHRRARRR